MRRTLGGKDRRRHAVNARNDDLIDVGKIDTIPHYVASATWEQYSEGTRKNYRRALDLLRAQIGDVLITDLDASRVDHYTHKIERRYGGAVADQQKALISNLWEEAKDHAEIDRKGKINPTIDTKVRYQIRKKTKAWSPEARW